jgi:hypothetical protein
MIRIVIEMDDHNGVTIIPKTSSDVSLASDEAKFDPKTVFETYKEFVANISAVLVRQINNDNKNIVESKPEDYTLTCHKCGILFLSSEPLVTHCLNCAAKEN